jgi:predicted  nucleic acid-binding Zn-ribbon protein
MALERLRELVTELRELVERIQAGIADRPLVSAAIDAMREKLTEMEDEVEAEGPNPV